MTTKDQITLNQEQQAAADGFFKFLFSPEKELIISGPAGVGKTFVMGHLIDRVLPEYFKACKLMGIPTEYDSVVMTATTNKAAEVLSKATQRPTDTIHSFMNLRVTDDHNTGRSKLTRTQNWMVHSRKIIFIDEASMNDSALDFLIQEGTHGCKIVYVGDHCQLAPVMEQISPIYTRPMPFFELTQPMRNAGEPALVALCDQLRRTVETGIFEPIQIVPGVIDWVDNAEMEKLLEHHFAQQTQEARILAYTNARVNQYNEHIRAIRSLPSEYQTGELLINNTAIKLSSRQSLSVEEDIEILDTDKSISYLHIQDHPQGKIELAVRYATIKPRWTGEIAGIPLPVDREHLAGLIKYYSKAKNWNRYFYLKNTIPDFRPRDAATIHKAQGSTYDVVFLDVGNLSTCHLPDLVARLLYVGLSRARHRVILYGNLAEKYGGLRR